VHTQSRLKATNSKGPGPLREGVRFMRICKFQSVHRVYAHSTNACKGSCQRKYRQVLVTELVFGCTCAADSRGLRMVEERRTREWCDPTQSCLHTTSASASVNHVGSPERAGQLRKQDRHHVQKKTTLMQVTQVSKKTWSTCMAVARMVVTRATALPADELVSSKSPSDSIPVCCDN
jgi:hypothetical protein